MNLYLALALCGLSFASGIGFGGLVWLPWGENAEEYDPFSDPRIGESVNVPEWGIVREESVPER